LDGRAQRSCVLPVSRAAGHRITTIEGLDPHGAHPVQRAWTDLDVVQCGYCQPGQIMAAAALLKEVPQPSDADIDAALSGNLCRCGTYQRIRAAVHRAAELAELGARPAGRGTEGAPSVDRSPARRLSRLAGRRS